jgi:hypothetical protein
MYMRRDARERPPLNQNPKKKDRIRIWLNLETGDGDRTRVNTDDCA